MGTVGDQALLECGTFGGAQGPLRRAGDGREVGIRLLAPRLIILEVSGIGIELVILRGAGEIAIPFDRTERGTGRDCQHRHDDPETIYCTLPHSRYDFAPGPL